MDMKAIYEYFAENDLPRPRKINFIGKWAKGECFAVSCGMLKTRKYCVYMIDGKVHSVRVRD